MSAELADINALRPLLAAGAPADGSLDETLSQRDSLVAAFFLAVRDQSRLDAGAGEVTHPSRSSIGELAALLAEQSRSQHDAGWFLAGLLVKLGLLGTVVGFVIMLRSVDAIESFDVSDVQRVLTLMSAGMGVALYTTLVGLVTSILLGFQYLCADQASNRLVAVATEAALRELPRGPKQRSAHRSDATRSRSALALRYLVFTHRARQFEQDPFTDLLFNALLGFTFLFLIAILFLNPPTKSGDIKAKAEIIVTTRWEDNSPDDIDTWVRSPDGATVWFRNPEAGLLHLDRDDRGMTNDVITVDGKAVNNPLNQEVVTIRGTSRGEYVVNLHYYNSETNAPVGVDVEVVKVNPVYKVVYFGRTTLPARGAERTAIRFTVSEDGEITSLSTAPAQLVRS